jgi:hypothetical protein
MSAVHDRHLDLNLLPVLVAVADTGSVTAAAERLSTSRNRRSARRSRAPMAFVLPSTMTIRIRMTKDTMPTASRMAAYPKRV